MSRNSFILFALFLIILWAFTYIFFPPPEKSKISIEKIDTNEVISEEEILKDETKVFEEKAAKMEEKKLEEKPVTEILQQDTACKHIFINVNTPLYNMTIDSKGGIIKDFKLYTKNH